MSTKSVAPKTPTAKPPGANGAGTRVGEQEAGVVTKVEPAAVPPRLPLTLNDLRVHGTDSAPYTGGELARLIRQAELYAPDAPMQVFSRLGRVDVGCVASELEGLAELLMVAGDSDERLTSSSLYFLQWTLYGLAGRLRADLDGTETRGEGYRVEIAGEAVAGAGANGGAS